MKPSMKENLSRLIWMSNNNNQQTRFHQNINKVLNKDKSQEIEPKQLISKNQWQKLALNEHNKMFPQEIFDKEIQA